MAPPIYDTAVGVSGADVPNGTSFLRVKGYAAVDDGGAAIYKKVDIEPLGGKVRSRDGAWWEIAEDVVRPEMFGFMGTNIADTAIDENAAATAIGDWARGRGRLHIRLRPGRKYSYTNPLWLTGIREVLTIDGYGASFQNIRATTHGAHTISANNECLVFPSIFYRGGRSLIGTMTPLYGYGELIETVAAGSTRVTLASGEVPSSFVIGERALIYGFATQTAAFPNTSVYFEYVVITAINGFELTVAEPLRFHYYSDWPVVTDSAEYNGPARIISLVRDSTYLETKYIEINGLRCMADPGWTKYDGGTSARNGRITIANYQRAVLNDVLGDGGMYVSQGQFFTDNGSKFSGRVELDKFVDLAEMKGVDYESISEGTGAYQVAISDSILRNVGPIDALDTLEIRRCRIDGYGASPTSRAFNGTFGTPKSIFTDNQLKSHSGLRSLRGESDVSASFTEVSRTRLDMPTTLFVSSNLVRVVRPGTILYNAGGEAVFRCEATPREASSRTFFDGQRLDGSYSDGDMLYCCRYPYVEGLRNRLIGNDGPREIFAMVGGRGQSRPMLSKRYDEYSADGRWVLPSTINPQISNTPFYFQLGFLVEVTKLTVVVARAYTGPTPVATLRIRRPGSATSIAIIDLKVTGQRMIDSLTETGATAHDMLTRLDGDPIGVLQIGATAPLAYASVEEDAVWNLIVEGVQKVD
ncbi:hypothetical protein RQ479_13250 [Mesorhizobium sp. ISC25]|uniref:hypothetical protein n=1 Tax=Mesorhizobium sp. ISC25 TaxID=3077335 RepID=UPI0035DDA382